METTSVGTLVSVGIARSVFANFSSVVPAPGMIPNMPADLAHRDLDPDAGQEADEDAARQEVGDEPELEQARGDERHAAHQRGQRRELDVLGRLGDRARREQAGGEDRRRRRVGTDDQVARRAEDREGEDRQQERVQAR